jgi:hypothetical protein
MVLINMTPTHPPTHARTHTHTPEHHHTPTHPHPHPHPHPPTHTHTHTHTVFGAALFTLAVGAVWVAYRPTVGVPLLTIGNLHPTHLPTHPYHYLPLPEALCPRDPFSSSAP